MRWLLIFYLAGNPVWKEEVNETQCKILSERKADGRYVLNLRMADGQRLQPENIVCIWENLATS